MLYKEWQEIFNESMNALMRTNRFQSRDWQFLFERVREDVWGKV